MNGYLRRKLNPVVFEREPKKTPAQFTRTKELKTTGRSGKLIAKNDELIQMFLKDENFIVYDTGVIVTNITKQGHKSDIWRIKPLTSDDGYLSFNYMKHRISVHRIVYAAFVGKLISDLVINHIDGNPSNNNSTNLELVTQSDNTLHSYCLYPRKLK